MRTMAYEKVPSSESATPRRNARLRRVAVASAVGAALLGIASQFGEKEPSKKPPATEPAGPTKKSLGEPKGGEPIGKNTLKGTKKEHSGEFVAAQKIGAPYANFRELEKRLAARELVPIADSDHYYISGVGTEEPNAKKAALYKTLRPATKLFLDFFAEKFFKKFETKLKITSLTRTTEYVTELRKRNKNASMTSSHLFGTTFDFSHSVMNAEQKEWVSKELLRLETAGVIEATMEHEEPCYHVFVIRH